MAKRKTAPQQVLDDQPQATAGDNVFGPAGQDQLRALTSRIMNLLDDRDAVNEDIREVFNEAKDSGFDTKVLRKAIAKKRAIEKDPAGYKSNEEMLDLYFATVHQVDLPMFESAVPRGDRNDAGEPTSKSQRTSSASLAPEASDPGGPTEDETAFA